MAYDSRKLLHYFRLLPNGRFLFGGRGGTDASDGGGEAYRPVLTGAFHELFPGLARCGDHPLLAGLRLPRL